MTSQRKLSAGIAGIMLLCSGAFAAGAPQGPPPTVLTAPAVNITVRQPSKYVGAVLPVEEVDVVPRITGTILKVCFRDGQMVRKGQLLYELEDTTYRAKADSARAQKKEIEAEINYARINFNRNNKLAHTNAVAQSNLDEATRLLATEQAQLKKIEANLRDAENDLSYCRIYSPLEGRIGENLHSAGNLVTPSTGKLANIVQLSPIYVKFSLSERTFRQTYGGMTDFARKALIRIRLADGTIFKETGTVGFIDNKIDSKSNTITIWAVFQNKDRELIPGGFATVLLSPKLTKPVVGVLQSALIISEKEKFVFVLGKGNKVERRSVELGSSDGNYQEICSGVNPGETVVVDGTHKLTPGCVVNPIPLKRK